VRDSHSWKSDFARGSSRRKHAHNSPTALAFNREPYYFRAPPPLSGGLDLNSRKSCCAHLGGEVGSPLGVVVEEVAALVVFVRRHRHAIRAAVRRAVDDEVPGAIEEETIFIWPLPILVYG